MKIKNEIEKKNLEKEKNNKTKLLNPKIDIVFQMLFSSQNTNITKGLISALIDKKIENIKLEINKQLIGNKIDDKVGIVDLRARLNNNIECEIEMQMVYSKNFIPRLLYYWSKIYSGQLKKGNKYNELNKVICISIINEDIKEFEELKAHSKWQIREEENVTKILTDKLELHIITIPKAIKEYKKNKKDKILQWMMFLNEPECVEVDEIMKENREIKEAEVALRELSEDEENQRIAELREKHILDTQDIYETGLDEGYKRGEKAGKIEGKREGKIEGKREGINEEKVKIAKKLLNKNMPIDQIIEVTELTKEEILKIKNENN